MTYSLAAGATAAWAEPVTLSNVALIETVPSAIAVTRPLVETVAILGFDDVHAAVVVTFSVVPFDMFATAAYCDVEPTAGAAPLTVTVDTVDGDVAELHAVTILAAFPMAVAGFMDVQICSGWQDEGGSVKK